MALREASGNMEFIWTPEFNETYFGQQDEEDLHSDSTVVHANREIFAHVLLTHYTPAKGTTWLANKYYRSGDDIISAKDADKLVTQWLTLF